MPTLRNAVTGVVVSCDDCTAERLGPEWGPVDGSPTTGYAAMKVADLKAEIERRNEGREEADLLPTKGAKADLIAALEADDDAAGEDE